METDVNRLHDLIINEHSHRGCGKTFLLCHSLCGEIEVGDAEEIICLGSTQNQLDFIRDMFEHIADEHKLNITDRRKDRMYINGKILMFITHDRWNKVAKYGMNDVAIYEDHYKKEENIFMRELRKSRDMMRGVYCDTFYNNIGEW